MRVSGIWFLPFLLAAFATAACSDTGNADAKQDGDAMVGNHETTGIKNSAAPSGVGRITLDSNRTDLYDLPAELFEISGLATSTDGRLFGHNDEYGVVYQIDPGSGDIVKRFTVGKFGVEEDFEGIAIVRERFFLVNSSGELFEFTEGEDRGHVDFTLIKTGLKSRNDVEGLCYDPSGNALLLVCKEHPGKGFAKDDQKTIYAFSLDRMELDPDPVFVLDARRIREELDLKEFKPSAIERNPAGGSFVILSSREPSVIEIADDGALLAASALDHPALTQPEGIAFAGDGRVIISSEGGQLLLAPLLKGKSE